MTNSDDIETQLERAGNYFMSGRFKRAAALYRSVLTQDPGNLRALSPMARIDAELGRTTMEEALTNLKELAAVHPDDEAPPRVMIGVLYRLQRWEECAVVRRALLDRYPESPVVLQMWANGLQVDPKTKSDPEHAADRLGVLQEGARKRTSSFDVLSIRGVHRRKKSGALPRQ